MFFWIIVIALAVLCGALLARAALRGRAGAEPPAAYDLRVYRDQLKEVDRDLARGVIGEEDADRLRTEVSRRILAADAKLRAGDDSMGQPKQAGWVLAGLALAVAVGGSAYLYRTLGAPGYEDLPLAQRIAASDAAREARLNQADVEARLPTFVPPADVSPEYLTLMERLRETVADRPDDLQGLGLLVRNEAALGNFAAARKAQAQIIEVKGPEATAFDYALLSDLMVSAAGGYVTSDAEAALRAALARDPQEPRARYYLGLFLLQVDRPDSAFRLWKGLLDEGPADAPWIPLIRSQIEEVAWRAGVTNFELPPEEAPPGPSAEDIEAAGEMSAEARGEMIRGMVARLSDRLANEGGTAEEWARLIGAYGVLGETDRARVIWAEAQEVFAGREADLELLRAAATRAGIAE